MKRLALILVLASACTNSPAATSILKAGGYSNVTLTGYRWYACDKSDTCTGFRATSATGAVVTGAVGCLWYSQDCVVYLDASGAGAR